MPRTLLTTLALGGLLALPLSGAKLSLDLTAPGPEINPAMWGAFFEDINFGADGGLYAELIKNRGFEFPDAMMGWNLIRPSNARGEVTVREDNPFNAKNAHYLRIHSTTTAPIGVSNEGFRGIGVRKGERYNFSVRVRKIEGAPLLRLQLFGEDGTLLALHEFKDLPSDWSKLTAVLEPSDTDAKCHLQVLIAGAGSVDLDFVSLFPEKTWKGRTGGLRADMVQALADLHPGFLRFPGGCIVEGHILATRYQWKNTLGPVEERPLLINRWNFEFVHRPTPDYFQSFGLGFFEFFQLCEDIGSQPLPILNCGMACQFNSGELCPIDDLETYIQDAIDLIEFANGDVSTPWGAKRAAMGHPEPFNLKMIGIGNEQWGADYIARYEKFAKELKAKHPEIQLVSAAGPEPADKRFDFAWSKLRELKADIIDEHSYAKPEWFFNNAHRYDSYDRNGPKVFMGEYAAQSVATVNVKNRNTFLCALSEAAYLTGLERNADVVRMASYAPLFAHVDAWQWTPNLIWTDNLQTLRTANYYVQQLYARNRGDVVLPTRLTDLSGPEEKTLYASSVWDTKENEIIIKLVNSGASAAKTTVALGGAKTVRAGTLTVLQSDQPDAYNTMAQRDRIAPKTSKFEATSSNFELSLPAQSFTVLRVGVSK